MKILAVNNYQIEDGIGKYSRPAQHFWGVDYLREKGLIVDTICYNGYSPNRFLSFANRVLFNIKILCDSRKYDAVISFHSPILDFLGIFKSMGLMRANLYTFIHHYEKKWHVSGAFDKLFFISRPIMKVFKEENPKSNAVYIAWGADLSFYDHYLNKEKSKDGTVRFFSNGRTNRDIDIIIKATKETKTSLTLLRSDKIVVDGQVILSRNQKEGALISRSEMMKYVNNTDISLISVPKNFSRTSLSGLNSFIDATASGQPIIMSDNTNIGVDIEKLGIGLIYKAGDIDDLITKIEFFKNNPEKITIFGANARRYAERNSYSEFCKDLFVEISNT